jgi:serine/threonine protein kinase
VYQIGEQLSDVTFGKVFKALHVGTMMDVVIRSFRVGDGSRAFIWAEIFQEKNSSLLQLIEAVEGDGRRIEVIQAAPSVTLREWAGRRKASRTEIELVVRQLSQALGSLHKRGVVHLNVRPDTIFVRSTEGGLSVLLGGFETAAFFQGDDPVELSADPFYAPPEAVGLYHYPREPGLRAWDWWSLGRVVQEVVLGRHILGHMLERDVTRESPELRTRAENLLKEQDANTRAGAVEMMPAMDRELTTLLRGLLTGSRDGRWGLVEVESWLRKEPVKDRYTLPRHERLFFWKDRAYTVPEAAALFALAEHWQDGVTNIFEPTNPSTLAHFIGSESALKRTKERFDLLKKLGEAPALDSLPPEIVRDVTMAVALKFLAGHDAALILRGRNIDVAALKALLAPDVQPLGLGTVYGLIARPTVQQIDQLDAEVGRLLGELGRVYEAASSLAQQNKWLSANGVAEMAAFTALCLETEIALNTTRTGMLKKYACSRDRALDRLFRKKDANLAELVVIVYTLREPEKFGYVTHNEWNSEQYRVLSERGGQLAATALWLRLGHALRLGPLVFGRWRIFIPVWCVLALAVAFVGQNLLAYLAAGACSLGMIVVRILWFGFHRTKLQHRLHASRPWTLHSGWAHCHEEALAVLKADSAPEPKALMRLLRETNELIAKLTLDPAPKLISSPASFKDTQAVSLASWVLVLALSASTAWYGVKHPPKMPTVKWDWITSLWSKNEEPSSASAKQEKQKPSLSLDQAPAVGVKSIQNTLEELRRAKREADKQDEPQIKISWPFKTPLEARFVRIQESTVALPEQIAVAEEMALLLVERYDPETINATIAVQVPTEKGVGLMLYDGRTRKISDRKVYTIAFVPFARSWIEIDSKKVIFLGGL